MLRYKNFLWIKETSHNIIMLKDLATCIGFQVILGFLLFSLALCDCPFPEKNLPNGAFWYQVPSDVNETVAEEMYVLRFKCRRGYTRIGPRFIQCVDDQWTDVVPICAKMQCSIPPTIPKAEYILHAGVDNYPTLGSSATYSCKIGYELNNTDASTIHCVLDLKENKGVWKGEMPFCKEKESCPNPGVSKYGSRRGHCCFSGDVLRYSCHDKYELVGEEEITCLPTGSWSSGRPRCRPLGDHCELPPSIPHGVAIGDKDGDYFLPYDEAEVLCEPGYKYKGQSRFIECQEDGKWEHEFGECIETFCDRPQPLLNGTIPELETTNLTTFPYKFEITYICDERFRLLGGDSWRTCDAKGWSGKTPYCEVIRCPDPGAPENGLRVGDNFEVGEKVRFKCFTGYTMIGSLERYCMPNGQWQGELTRCDAPFNYCPNPGIPVKGSKNSTDYSMGDVVGFECHPGYILIGSEARECLPNRTWSGTETRCLGPYDFDNGAQVRDALKAKVAEKAEKQKQDLQKFKEALHASWHNGSVPLGRMLDINYPGRLILYFAFDVSGSVGQHNFDKSIQFAKAIVNRVGISVNGARAGALTFSSKAENMFLPLTYTNTKDVLDAFDKINYTGGGTAASSALTLIRKQNIPLVSEVFVNDKNIKSVIFILTDGKANMGGSPQKEAEILKKAGVEIYCIGITGSIEKESLYKIASTTLSSNEEYPNVYILQNYATLSWLVQEITNGTVDYSQCGLGMENVGTASNRGKIVGGVKSKEPWPWMAALYMPQGKAIPPQVDLQCGGSVIHKYFILTAAHCLYEKKERRNEKSIMVKLGVTDVKNETYVQESDVAKIFIHPQYRPGFFFDYDIALLYLSRPIEYNPFVRPICLPPKDLEDNSLFYKRNEYAWAIGWGHEGIVSPSTNEQMKPTQNLKEIAMPIQSTERCLNSLADNNFNTSYFTNRMFCAGDGERGNDTCKGDSGGPLMQSQLNSEGYLYWTQVGIVSWGIGCGQKNTYGYYTHVQRLRSWIDETMEGALNNI